MQHRDSTEASIIRVGAISPAVRGDAYVIELRYSHPGVRRANVAPLIGPNLPESEHTTAIVPYLPDETAIVPHVPRQPAPPRMTPMQRFGSSVAVGCLVVIGLAAFGAIRIQQLAHDLYTERRDNAAAKIELARVHSNKSTSSQDQRALTNMAANLQQATARAAQTAEERKLHSDALLAASAGAVDQSGRKQLTDYVARLRQQQSSPGALDTLNAMGASLAARDLAESAATCFAAVLDSTTCTRAQRLLALAGMAEAMAKQAKLDEADSLYRELIDLERADKQLTPRALAHLADWIKIKIRRDLEDDANEAVSGMFTRLAGERATSLEPAQVRQTLLGLTDFAVDHEHPAVAIRLLERALTLKDASISSAGAAPFRQMLLTLHAQNGSELEARRTMKKLLAQQSKQLGQSPEVANTAMQLAALDEQLGDLYSAERSLKLALNIRERLYGNDHPDVADTAYALARVYERQGRRSESDALLGLVKGIWARKRSADSARDPFDDGNDSNEGSDR